MRKTIKTCKLCGLDKPVSQRGLCRECSEFRVAYNIHCLKSKSGDLYKKWLTRYLEGVLLSLKGLEASVIHDEKSK